MSLPMTPELYYSLLIVVFLGAWGNGERLKRKYQRDYLASAEIEGADADSKKRAYR